MLLLRLVQVVVHLLIRMRKKLGGSADGHMVAQCVEELGFLLCRYIHII